MAISGATLARALDYPYSRPEGSFVFALGDGSVHRIEDLSNADVAGTTPVLAVGSNASPEVLARKFLGCAGSIVVSEADLVGYDVVFSAHLASYGAVPATVIPSPGTVVSVHITWLDPRQIEIMHRSEGLGTRYELVTVPRASVRSGVPVSVDPLAYVSIAGPLHLSGQPLALQVIPASGRRFPEAAERDVLGALARACGLRPGDLVERLVSDEEFRRSAEALLPSLARV